MILYLSFSFFIHYAHFIYAFLSLSYFVHLILYFLSCFRIYHAIYFLRYFELSPIVHPSGRVEKASYMPMAEFFSSPYPLYSFSFFWTFLRLIFVRVILAFICRAIMTLTLFFKVKFIHYIYSFLSLFFKSWYISCSSFIYLTWHIICPTLYILYLILLYLIVGMTLALTLFILSPIVGTTLASRARYNIYSGFFGMDTLSDFTFYSPIKIFYLFLKFSLDNYSFLEHNISIIKDDFSSSVFPLSCR